MCMYTRIWQYPIDWIFYKLYLFYTKGTSHLHKFYRSLEEVVAEPAPGTHTRPDVTELCLVSLSQDEMRQNYVLSQDEMRQNFVLSQDEMRQSYPRRMWMRVHFCNKIIYCC